MKGYCGREVVADQMVAAGPKTAAAAVAVKPAAGTRDRVVRIGPRQATAAQPGDRAAAA